MLIGSLFSGYGGLDLGVQSVLGGTVAWHSDNDPGASKILAHHWPTIPNLGDITTVDWREVEPVDVITGGFPCQDVSHAGKRLGMNPGTRSGLWSQMAYAISVIRPALVVAENVRGLLSARADGDLEPCPWCLGDERDDALRALGAVLGDLAGLGYDARWCGVRAADVGAPHGRFRVFVVATDARLIPGHSSGWARREFAGRDGAPTADADTKRRQGQPSLPSRAGDAPEPVGRVRRGGDAASDTRRERHGRGQDGRSLGRLDGGDESQAQQRERARAVAGDRGAEAAADADGGRRQVSTELDSDPSQAAADWDSRRGHVDGHPGPVAWGQYEPAVRRWESVLGRVAPAPTEPGSKGQPRLSPRFVEWLMGLPAGHVTDVPGLSRNDQLKALGNGVVPQQAAAAVAMLLETERAA